MTATTIFLLWQLLGGLPADVDAFTSQEQCEKSKVMILERLKSAIEQTHDKRLEDIQVIGCQPYPVQLPKVA